MSQRVWFARDTGLTSDPKVQPLGDELGPGVVLALEEMLALAKLKDNGGSMTTSYATLARRSFITPAKAKQLVAAAAAGDDPIIELTQATTRDFSARFLKWSRWQPRDPTGAARKAAQRERDAAEKGTP